MEKGIVKVSVISLVVILFAIPAFSQTQRQPEPIKIGGSLALTGVFAESAKWVKAGYEFWAEDVNKRGGLLGRPVRLTIYDDEGVPEKAVTYYERAITVDKVDLVFGGYPGPNVAVLMPLMEKYGKVFVSQGAQFASFEQGYTYSFASPGLNTRPTGKSFEGAINDLIVREERPKSMAIFTMNNVSGRDGRAGIIAAAERCGIKVAVDEFYNLPLTDAKPLALKAKATGAELVCKMSFFDDDVMITREIKAMNYNPKMIWSLLAPTLPAWMKEFGPDGKNVICTMVWHPRLPFPGNEIINEAAKTKFKLSVAPAYFGLGYCWMKTLELSVQGAGTLDHKRIRDYLRSHKFDLPYGKGITFDQKGLNHPDTHYVLQTAEGGLEILWPKEIATGKIVYPKPKWSK